MSTNGEKIILGSGKLYVTEYSGAIPADTEIEAVGNLLGYIQGGATLSYKPTFYLAEDDLGLVKKQILTKEEVSLKSGIMTWNGDTLKRLISTARVTENGVTNKRLVKIGGISNQDGKRYIVRFVHEDATDGDVRVTIVGGNQGELALSFAKDKETVIDAEFMAIPHDSEGTLVLFEEDIAGLVSQAEEAIKSMIPVVLDGSTAKAIRNTLKGNKNILFLSRPNPDQDLLLFFHDQFLLLWNRLALLREKQAAASSTKKK